MNTMTGARLSDYHVEDLWRSVVRGSLAMRKCQQHFKASASCSLVSFGEIGSPCLKLFISFRTIV